MALPKLVVGITQGDSNGIGYEVIIKSLADERCLDSFTPVVYGSSKLMGFYRKTLHNIESMDINVISSAKDAKQRKINLVNCLPDSIYAEPGQSTPESAKNAITALQAAFANTGHTEYLQKEFGADDVTMIMVSDQLKVGVVTGHIPLRDVPKAISKDSIVGKLKIMKASLERDFGINDPKIAVLGLNPHCGDGGLLGDEEQNIILPAVKEAQAQGIQAFGPYSPDGFFGLGNYSRFDATLAMYHDQGLAPFKAIAFAEGVNFTAGLPVVRTSPDHGTAYEMAGRDEADPRSMMSAIYTAIDIFRRRLQYDTLMEGRLKEE